MQSVKRWSSRFRDAFASAAAHARRDKNRACGTASRFSRQVRSEEEQDGMSAVVARLNRTDQAWI
jgi:hypothetical protein